ncbi:restriction endonuclease [Paenibacillus sanguinis]|uniref:restriction endonuclease n=1 Tax=Paenibacillus sanguinis TaxID=225906 RepID=UPI003B82E91C
MDGSNFEKLCTDLMSRSGYPDIIPVGGMHDRGRDAEVIRYTSGGEKQVIFISI